MNTSANNYPKIDLLTNIISKLKEVIRETNRDIRNNENTLYERKKELKKKLQGNPEPSIVDNITKEIKMLSAAVVKQKKIVEQAEAFRRKLSTLQYKLGKVNKKIINNINKELNPKKPSMFSGLFTKKNAQNQKNKTLNNLKNLLSKRGLKELKGINLTEIANFNAEKVAVNDKNIEEEFQKFMADVEELKKTTSAMAATSSSAHASYLGNMQRALVNTGSGTGATANNEEVRKLEERLAALRGTPRKGGKSRRHRKSRKASRRRLTRRRR